MAATFTGASYDARSDWTALTEPPAPDPRLCLTPRSPVSFVVNDVDALTTWLKHSGRHTLPGRAATEHSRLRRGRRLIVLYHSGSVLIQGPHPDETVAELQGAVQR